MFRFTIRDVIWLTVVVALAVGWWSNRESLLKAKAKSDGATEDLKASYEHLHDEAQKSRMIIRALDEELHKATGKGSKDGFRDFYRE